MPSRNVTGVDRIDFAVLHDMVGKYVAGVRWEPHYVEYAGEDVLVVVVEAPRNGDLHPRAAKKLRELSQPHGVPSRARENGASRRRRDGDAARPAAGGHGATDPRSKLRLGLNPSPGWLLMERELASSTEGTHSVVDQAAAWMRPLPPPQRSGRLLPETTRSRRHRWADGRAGYQQWRGTRRSSRLASGDTSSRPAPS